VGEENYGEILKEFAVQWSSHDLFYVFQSALVEQALPNQNGINRLHKECYASLIQTHATGGGERRVRRLVQILILMGLSFCYFP
jgi:hypothetical protein